MKAEIVDKIICTPLGKRTLLGIALFLLCVLPGITETIPWPDIAEQRIPQAMEQYGIPGAALLLLEEGEIRWQGYYGHADLEKEKPITRNTIFRGESLSKTAAAWGILSLMQEKDLPLDSPAEPLLAPWSFPETSLPEEEITVKQLLSNTSGLGLGTIGPETEYSPGTPTPPLERLLSEEASLVQPPGMGFLYSDTGFNTLDLLALRLSGRPFSAFMEEEIFRPLGMDQSSFSWREEYKKTLATGYEIDGTPVAPYVYAARASGGLFTTLEDWGRFTAALITQSPHPEMFRGHTDIHGLFGFAADQYGLGLFIEKLPSGETTVWHGGQGHGWMTHFHALPEEGAALIILTNSQRSWPFLGEVLSLWADYRGIGKPGFSTINQAGRVMTGLTVLLFLIGLFGAGAVLRRVVIQRPFPTEGPIPRRTRMKGILLLFSGSAGIALPLWRMSQTYVFETSLFPRVTPWFYGALISSGAIVILHGLLGLKQKKKKGP